MYFVMAVQGLLYSFVLMALDRRYTSKYKGVHKPKTPLKERLLLQ